jgi:hypothetical protein
MEQMAQRNEELVAYSVQCLAGRLWRWRVYTSTGAIAHEGAEVTEAAAERVAAALVLDTAPKWPRSPGLEAHGDRQRLLSSFGMLELMRCAPSWHFSERATLCSKGRCAFKLGARPVNRFEGATDSEGFEIPASRIR